MPNPIAVLSTEILDTCPLPWVLKDSAGAIIATSTVPPPSGARALELALPSGSVSWYLYLP